METKTEGLEPQKNQEEEAQKTKEVAITPKELEDLKKRAEVSSQNFERLKKSEKENEELRAKLLDSEPSEFEDEDIKKLKGEIAEIKGNLTKKEILDTYPQLKDVWNEFENFRNEEENLGMSLKTAAKAFLIEKDLLTKRRKGVENQTGGRAVYSPDMSVEDIKKLRETDYNKYREMLKKGQIKL